MNNLAGVRTAGALWTAALPVVCVRAGVFDWKSAGTGLFVAAVFSYLADLDHEGSTAGRAIGKVASRAIRRLGGGHRGLTHSLLAIAGAWVLLAWLTATLGTALWNADVQAAVAGLHPVAAVHALAPLNASPLAAAGAIGMAGHIFCDLLTVMGVPLLAGLWPLPKRWRKHKFRLAAIRTGSPAEERYVTLVNATWGLLVAVYTLFVLTSVLGIGALA